VPGLIIRRDGPVGRIVFSNPARMNAMTFDMWRALPEALSAFDADPAVRLVVLSGDGEKAFVSGADISQFEQNRASEEARTAYNQAVEAAYLAPLLCAKPVIAQIRGICMGGGLGLAAACDVRFCSDDAVFRMPAARLGLGYSFIGMRRFVQVLGAASTADIFVSARKFGAADALQMGFVQRVFPAADLEREVGAYAATVGENAPLSLIAAKAAIREVLKDPGDRDLAALQQKIDVCFASADYTEGRRAFMEKRTPDFKGR
jgi:enoyl-CoA hydratase/carnithine racemase